MGHLHCDAVKVGQDLTAEVVAALVPGMLPGLACACPSGPDNPLSFPLGVLGFRPEPAQLDHQATQAGTGDAPGVTAITAS